MKGFHRKLSWFSLRQTALMILAMMMLISNWQSNRTSVVYADSVIPNHSIRVRILANSNSIADQAMKRVVQNAVSAQLDEWALKPHSIGEARQIIIAHIPALQETVRQILAKHDYNYAYKVELGIVPFPVKTYGHQVYPAGNYEALLITLGNGQGHNWWCVLFPPLCFTNAFTGGTPATNQHASLQITSKAQIHFYLWDKSKVFYTWFMHEWQMLV